MITLREIGICLRTIYRPVAGLLEASRRQEQSVEEIRQAAVRAHAMALAIREITERLEA